MGDFAEAVLAVASLLGLGRAHFVGHSLGTHRLPGDRRRAAGSRRFAGLVRRARRAGRGDAQGPRRPRRTGAPRGHGAESPTRSSPTRCRPRPGRAQPAAVAFVRESLMRQNPEGYARTCEALADGRGGRYAADRGARRCWSPATPTPSIRRASARALAERIAGGEIRHHRPWRPLADDREAGRNPTGALPNS